MTWEPDDEDDPRDINIAELEGSRDITTPEIPADKVQQPLKIRKVNIGMAEDLKFANVGYYCDESTMAKITNLLHEF